MKKKSLSAKKKIPNNFRIFLKDRQVNRTFKKFASNIKNMNFESNICLALSGGPDLSLIHI